MTLDFCTHSIISVQTTGAKSAEPNFTPSILPWAGNAIVCHALVVRVAASETSTERQGGTVTMTDKERPYEVSMNISMSLVAL